MTDEPPPTWPETLSRAGVTLVPPPFGEAAKIVVDDVIVRRRAKSQEFLVAVTTGLDEGTLRRRLADDRVGTVVSIAGDAAVTSAHEAKRRALARVARNAVDDDAKVDEAELITRALSAIDSPHIAALARLAHAQHAFERTGSSEVPETLAANVERHSSRENNAVIAVLLATGLVRPTGARLGYGAHSASGVTPFGLTVLAQLDQPATAPRPTGQPT